MSILFFNESQMGISNVVAHLPGKFSCIFKSTKAIMSTVSNQKASSSSLLCCLFRVKSHLPPNLLRWSSQAGLIPSYKYNTACLYMSITWDLANKILQARTHWSKVTD